MLSCPSTVRPISHALCSQIAGPLGAERPLQIVCRHDAGEGDAAARAVNVGLAGIAAIGLGQAGPGVDGAEHEQAGAIERGHRNLRRTGVIGTHVDHHIGIEHGPFGIGDLGFRRPLAGGGRGVVPVGVFDAKMAGSPIRLFQRQSDATHDRIGLRLDASRARQARHDPDHAGRSDSSWRTGERRENQAGEQNHGPNVSWQPHKRFWVRRCRPPNRSRLRLPHTVPVVCARAYAFMPRRKCSVWTGSGVCIRTPAGAGRSFSAGLVDGVCCTRV